MSMSNVQAKIVPTCLDRHDDLFERAVARALAQPVDRAFDLARAADLHTSQRIGHSHAQVVMAMHRPDCLVAVRNTLAQILDEIAVQLRDGVSHGVGHVDCRGTLVDGGLQHPAQEVHIATVAILRAELHVLYQVACKTYGQLCLLEHLIGAHAQLLLHVQRRGCNEGMDARAIGTFERFRRARDVPVVCTRERADCRVLYGSGNRLHGFEVTVGTGGKAGLDHIHAQSLELASNTHFLVTGHRRSGRLFAITQGGIKNDEFVGHGMLLQK